MGTIIYSSHRIELVNPQVALVVKNIPANAGDIRGLGLILGSSRSPGRGNSNPLQNSCLENSMKRGNWSAHSIEKRQTQLKQLSTHTCLREIGPD